MVDLFFRAETPATLRTVVKSTAFRNIIGDLTDTEDDNSLRMIPGSVNHKYFPPGKVPDGQGGFDTWCWLHLRLVGAAEISDFDADPDDVEPDRWNKSRIRKWMQANGTLKTIRGVRVYEHTLGSGKRVQVWRGWEMAANGVLFHEFLGGNSY